jgi:signal transduction histidine kinase
MVPDMASEAVPDTGDVSAVAQNERLLLRVFALIRAATVALSAASLAGNWRSAAHPLFAALLVAALMGENVAAVRAFWRRGWARSRQLAVADVSFGIVTLVVMVIVLKSTANPDSDNMIYPYSVASVTAAGLAFRRLSSSLAMAAAVVIAYLTATIWRFGVSPHIVLNSLTYWVFAGITWVLATRFRRLSAEVDEARQAAIVRERELAQERERMRYARDLHTIRIAAAQRLIEEERQRTRISRDLHDRVLQTLEFVGRDACISDARVRDHVAAEAVWLRSLVRGELGPGEGELVTALDAVVAAATDAGLQVEANMAGLRADPLAREVIEAVAGAVTELLTNVRKHAGTTRAVLRAVSEASGVIVTVLDHGCGFDPLTAAQGIGLRESVMARIRLVNGRVVITSEPGAGTHVEISVPVPERNGAAPDAPPAACPENA